MKMRLRKDGGYSECNSPDELVGKGRCIHVLEIGADGVEIEPLEVKRTDRGVYNVEIPNNVLSNDESRDDIINFINHLPKISKSKEQRIIQQLVNS